MSEIQETASARTKRASWQIIALTVVVSVFVSVLATISFGAVADSDSLNIRGGNNAGATLKCPGGMDSLEHVFNEQTTVFPGDPLVQIEIVNTIPVDFFLLEKITTGTHGGTHLDAPRHFLEDGRSIDMLNPEEFVFPAYVIDVRDRVMAEGPDFQLEKADIKAYEDAYGRIKKGSMVIIHTGHDMLFGSDLYTAVNHPGFSGDAVNWLIDKRKISGLGSDGLGPDASIDANFDATFNMLAADGIAIPGLANLDSMNVKGDMIIAPAVRLEGGSGYQVNPLACHGVPQYKPHFDWSNHGNFGDLFGDD